MMAFELTRGRGVGSEIRKLLARQLTLAIEQLRATPPDVAGARRHLKKSRALLLVAKPAFATADDSPARRLQKASRLLGPMIDAQTRVKTLTKLRGYDPQHLPEITIGRLRRTLATEAARLNGGVESAWLRARVIRILKRERAKLARAAFSKCGVHATAAAIRRAHRDARSARKAAAAVPGTESLHAWRRRSKAEWYLLRLIAPVVKGRLIDDQRRVEQLDQCLGAAHDMAVLQQEVMARSTLPRPETAAALVAMRAYVRDLKRRAAILADAQDESPRDLEARVLAVWLSGAGQSAVHEGTPWHSRA